MKSFENGNYFYKRNVQVIANKLKSMKLDEFPKYDDVKKSIIRLKQKGFPRYDGKKDIESYVKTIEDIISNEFRILINYIQPFKHKDFSLNFFRVRKFDDFQNISLIREHSYPPINVTKMGRCNFPHIPVFYCSNDGMTALLETTRNVEGPNTKFCISKWELNKTDENLIFQNFLQTPLPTENHFNIIQKGIREKINEPFLKSLQRGLDEDRQKGLIEYLKFLDYRFIIDDNYSLSASLAYRALFTNHNYRADILMYPSVQSQSKGVNMALNPNFVENNLSMKRLYEISMDKYDFKTGKINVTFYRYAKVEKNMLWWHKISPENQDYINMIKEDFGHLIKNKDFSNTFKERKNNLP